MASRKQQISTPRSVLFFGMLGLGEIAVVTEKLERKHISVCHRVAFKLIFSMKELGRTSGFQGLSIQSSRYFKVFASLLPYKRLKACLCSRPHGQFPVVLVSVGTYRNHRHIDLGVAQESRHHARCLSY